MKYIIELEKLAGTDLYKAKGANTLVFDEWGIKNILTPLSKPETEPDWSTVAIDTPMLVGYDGATWFKAHFAKYENGESWVWSDGKTSFTTDGSVSSFAYAKLAEVEE